MKAVILQQLSTYSGQNAVKIVRRANPSATAGIFLETKYNRTKQ
jgi:hypothetical protein